MCPVSSLRQISASLSLLYVIKIISFSTNVKKLQTAVAVVQKKDRPWLKFSIVK